MFFQGDLQAGISLAVQESKFVACFVTDDGKESQTWETLYLLEESVSVCLREQAVLLRLEAGSQEANHLAAIYPLPKSPTLVVIKNGELKEYLTSGLTQADFSKRLCTALATAHVMGSGVVAENLTYGQASQASHPARATTSQRDDPVAQQQPRSQLKKQPEATGEEKESSDGQVSAGSTTQKPSVDRYALLQRKRQQEARDERARILERVRHDKERRRLLAVEKANQVGKQDEVHSPANSSDALPIDPTGSCALQVRLFDGSSVRSIFPSAGSLRKDVKPWVDEKQDSDVPYTFKQILTPFPNKDIEAAEEDHSLHSLGLTPNATLILVPVREYTSAYAAAGGLGSFSNTITTAVASVSTGIGSVLGVFGRAFAGPVSSRTPPVSSISPADPPSTVEATSDSTIPGNIQTLGSSSAQDSQEFYNGNALSFVPRPEDGKKTT